LADHEIGEGDYWGEDTKLALKIAKEKSLEALKLTPCEKPAPPPPPPPPAPAPAPPPPAPKPAPPPPPPKAAPVFENAYFNENKTNIDPLAAKALDRDGEMLKENPGIKVEIGGHTDAVGSQVARQKISEKRAESAKKYLMDKFNIAGDRMMVKGYGSTKPIADNSTKEGRAKNRRVEIRVVP
jgi:OOP family OmpA-OmpF porin